MTQPALSITSDTPRRAARIGAPGSALVLPAATPYEREILCEHAAAAARLHGAVRMHVNGVDSVVRRTRAGASRCCAHCGRRSLRVSFRMAWRDLCLACAQRWLANDATA